MTFKKKNPRAIAGSLKSISEGTDFTYWVGINFNIRLGIYS